jgi:hypothetical protein
MMKRGWIVLATLVFCAFAFGQNGEVAPNEDLVTEGIPNIPTVEVV